MIGDRQDIMVKWPLPFRFRKDEEMMQPFAVLYNDYDHALGAWLRNPSALTLSGARASCSLFGYCCASRN